ncbi:hippocampus abundant transcript 1 protein, partial [Tribonema minus]
NRFFYVLPVLFFEFLAIAMARSLIPGLMVDFFGEWTYHVIGVVETVKGLLAFAACPMFGRLSDVIGRRRCLLLTVVGTTLPVCSLAFTSSLWTFVALQSLSGCFAATFPLTFAYIADFVPKARRAPAYGLALATFGLSYSVGPVAGGYLAHEVGAIAVFASSIALVAIDIAYILLVLPESVAPRRGGALPPPALATPRGKGGGGGIAVPIPAILRRGTPGELVGGEGTEYLPFQWNPLASLRAFDGNPLLHRVAVIVFLYYTGVWAVVSTLMVYVTRKFAFDAVTVGQLLGMFGACTMFAEGVLVRYLVPWLGEKLTMQLGLLGFTAQCVMIGLADSPYMIFASMGGSLLSNLVYPAMSSLVSRSVSTAAQGEVLGTINGVRALTEGFGPLIFGALMSQFEGTLLPGAPYLIAGGVSVGALVYSFGIPDETDDALCVGTFGADSDGFAAVELQPLLAADDAADDAQEGDAPARIDKPR